MVAHDDALAKPFGTQVLAAHRGSPRNVAKLSSLGTQGSAPRVLELSSQLLVFSHQLFLKLCVRVPRLPLQSHSFSVQYSAVIQHSGCEFQASEFEASAYACVMCATAFARRTLLRIMCV